MSERKERCETCGFSDGVNAFRPTCHRNAPIVYVNNRGDEIAAWPPVAFDYWCGEYKPREGSGVGPNVQEKSGLDADALTAAWKGVIADKLGRDETYCLVSKRMLAEAIAKYLEVAK